MKAIGVLTSGVVIASAALVLAFTGGTMFASLATLILGAAVMVSALFMVA